MRMAIGATAAAAALLVASAAQAAVVVTTQDLGNPRNTDGVELTGYQAYLVRLTSDTGNITGVDFGGSPGSTFGLFGTFLQRADIDQRSGARTLTPENAARNNERFGFSFDSHFFPAAAGERATTEASLENNNFQNPPGAPADDSFDDYGAGSFLTGTFGIQPAFQSTTYDVAYLVLPDGQPGNYRGQIATANGTFLVSGPIGVPEPASISLIAAAGLLALRRRRI